MATPKPEFLAHYSSKYYDPVKAREYYLRTRELKGREAAATANLSKESRERQTEGTAYVRDQISTQKKAALDKNQAKSKADSEAYTARIQELSARATDTQKRIEQKLKAYLEGIDKNLKIPANASPKLRAFLEQQQARQKNSARKKTSNELRALQKNLRSVVQSARAQYRSTREANSTERKSIVDQYKKDLETETQNIKNQVR